MGNITIIEEKPISMVEMKKHLENIKNRDTELNFRSAKTEEYLNDFAKLKQKEESELIKKLTDLNISRLRDIHIIKLVDLLPIKVEELKVIMSGFNLTLSAENMKKIIDITSEYNKL